VQWRFAVPAQETLLRNHKHADESVKHTEQRMYQRQASRAVSVAQPHRRLTAKTTGESPAAVSHWSATPRAAHSHARQGKARMIELRTCCATLAAATATPDCATRVHAHSAHPTAAHRDRSNGPQGRVL
jgi:hypothetical protein